MVPAGLDRLSGLLVTNKGVMPREHQDVIPCVVYGAALDNTGLSLAEH